MSTICNSEFTKNKINDFLNSYLTNDKLNLSEDDFLAKVDENYSNNVLALNMLKRELNDKKIHSMDDILDQRIGDVSLSQLHSEYKDWSLKDSTSVISLFKSNVILYNKIENAFLKDAIKYCIIDTNIYAETPIIQTEEDLFKNVSIFKQLLILDLINKLDIVDENGNSIDLDTIIFDFENGADGDIYDKVMKASKTLLRNCGLIELPNGTFDLTKVDINDRYLVDTLYQIIALNNFDILLEKTLDGVIKKNAKEKSGDLNRTKYYLNKEINQELLDAQIIADDARSNAMSFITPTFNHIIKTIPVVKFNYNQDVPIKIIKNAQPLQNQDILQLGNFIKLHASLFKEIFDIDGIDFQRNPVESLEKVLKGIHDGVINYYNKSKKNTDVCIKFIKSINKSKELTTALSLYEFLFNNENRLDDSTQAIKDINLGYHNMPKFNIINEIIFQMNQSVAPAYSEHDQFGLLYSKNESNTTSEKYIQKVRNNKANFILKNTTSLILYTESGKGENSDIAKSILKIKKQSSKNPLVKALQDADYLNAAKQILGILLINDLLAIELMNQINDLPGFSLFDFLKNVAEAITKIQPLENSWDRFQQVQTIINNLIQSETTGINTEIGDILSTVLDTSMNPVFMTKQGNMLGIFRTTSLVFLHDHCIKRYKILDDIEKNKSNLYIPLRQRSNFFVANPEVLRSGDNDAYQSTVAIPLKMGIGDDAVDAQKQTEFNLDIRQFAGDFLSLITGVRNGKSAPIFAFLLGTYADKKSLPELVINAKAKITKDYTILDLLKRRDLLIHFNQAYESTRLLDLANKIISDWKTILLGALNEELLINKGSKEARRFIEIIKKNLLLINSILTVDLKSDEIGSHSDLFNKWLLNPSNKVEFKELMSGSQLGSVSNLRDKLLQSQIILDKLFSLDTEAFKAFKSELIPQLGEALDIQIVEELHSSLYDKTTFKLNRVLFDDLAKLCTIQDVKSIKYDGKLHLTEIETDSLYYQDQILKALTKELNLKTGTPISFLLYMINYFSNSDIMPIVYNMLLQASVTEPIGLFKDIIIQKNGKYELDVNQLLDAYSKYLLLTNFLRHQALDLGVKEAYEDKAKDTSSIEKERSSRLTTTTKRNNAYTATIMPFTMNLIDGISHKTRICVIKDIDGGVMNTIGVDSAVVEYDGLGLESPLLVRMEDVSLNKNHRFSTKKTFITTVDDYFTGELKWAVNEITNKKIRLSLGCKISLLSVFKRMHNKTFPANTNICSFWKNNGKPRTIYLNNLIGKDLYARDGFKYYRYESINFLKDNNYSITRTEVDNTGKDIQQSESITVNISNLFDLYSNLGGYNSMELNGSQLEYSENIMDVLYQFVINVGEYKKNNEGKIVSYDISQDNIIQPLRDCFTGILATEGSNKRGSANIVRGEAWFDDNIPLNTYHVELATGGEQLSAEHEATGSMITKSTQLMQALTQKGYTSELIENLYNSIAQMMNISSSDYNKIEELILQNDDVKLSEEICNKIVKNLELSGLNENIINLITEFKRQHELINENKPDNEKIPFSLPLSLIVKDVIKSYAPELNKEVIKQKDSGLMGVLNGSSGFIQMYRIGDKNYSTDDIFKNIEELKEFEDTILYFLLNTALVLPDSSCLFKSTLTPPTIDQYGNLIIKSDLILENKDVTYLIKGDLQLATEEGLEQLKEAINIAEDFLKKEISDSGYYIIKINPNSFKNEILYNDYNLTAVGDVVISKDNYIIEHVTDDEYVEVINGNNFKDKNKSFDEVLRVLQLLKLNGTLDSDLDYFKLYSFESSDDPSINNVLINLLETINNPEIRRESAIEYFNDNPNATKFLGFEKILTKRLEPGVTIIDVDGNNVLIDSVDKILKHYENSEYAIVDKLAPIDLQPLILEIETQSGKFENEYTSFESQLGARINRLGTNELTELDYVILKNLVDYLSEVDKNHEYDNLKVSISNKTISDAEKEELLKIQEDLCNFKNHLKCFGFSIIECLDFKDYYKGFNPRLLLEHQLQLKILKLKLLDDFQQCESDFNFYIEHQATKENKEILKKTNFKLFAAEHPEFVFKALPYNKHLEYKKYLLGIGFDEIINSNLTQAQIIMPNIYRNEIKIGNIDILDVDLNSFSKAPTFYNLIPSYYNEDGKINVDFIVRGFRGQYGVVFTDDISQDKLNIYGNSIKDKIKNNIDNEGYRLDPRTKQRMYKLPDVPYDIRCIGKTETIIILNKDNSIDECYKLIQSDDSMVSVQPFLYNILNEKGVDYGNLNQKIQRFAALNTIPAFENTYRDIDDILRLSSTVAIKSRIGELLNHLNSEFNNKKSEYKNQLRNSMFVSFLRSLDVISTRIPTQNMSSVMTMKIAAFTKSNVNDVFVTKWLNWLQGSKLKNM